MTVPTRAETYAQLVEHIAKAQEASAMMAHLTRDDDRILANGWLKISELFKRLNHEVIMLATKGRFN